MIKPFYEDEHSWYDIEFYNAENVAEMGEHADTKKSTVNRLPPLEEIAQKAEGMGYDCFSIKENTEVERHYYTDSN